MRSACVCQMARTRSTWAPSPSNKRPKAARPMVRFRCMQVVASGTKFTPYQGRRRTREVMVGKVAVGGNNPIRVQSMTTTLTKDVDATVAQTIRLVDAGCEIVRITTPTVQDARALGETKAK